MLTNGGEIVALANFYEKVKNFSITNLNVIAGLLHISRGLNFNSGINVEYNEDKQAWQSFNDDPQIYVSLPLPRGWVKVEIVLSKDFNIQSSGKLYFDYGYGYNEDNSLDLGKLDKYFDYIYLERDIKGLRYDPVNIKCEFCINSFKLIKITGLEVFLRVIFKKAIKTLTVFISFIKFLLNRSIKWRNNHGRIPSIREIPILFRKARFIWSSSNKYKLIQKNELPEGFTLPETIDFYDAWQEVNIWNINKEQILQNQLDNEMTIKPLISIIMPVYNPPMDFLDIAIQSVLKQKYQNWQLCLVDDDSEDKAVSNYLENISGRDSRIIVSFNQKNENISMATNKAVTLAKGEYLLLLDQDDELTEDALAEIALYINNHQDVDIVYSDDDKIDTLGNKFAPQFKPDWSPELLLSFMYFSHVLVIRRSLFNEVGGMRRGFEGSQDYDLVLRATEKTSNIGHISKILYHWRVLPNSTASSGAAKPFSIEAGRKAVADAIRRRGINAAVDQVEWAKKIFCGIYEVVFPNNGPNVTIIIPTKNNKKVLERCLNSLYKTSYLNFDILLVDNESDDKETINYIKNVSHRVLNLGNKDKTFNFSYLMNEAVKRVESEYILFLNDDTEVISENWLSQMIGYFQIAGVGAVGAKLLFPDKRIQHAGIIHGLHHGLPGHAFKLIPSWNNGYMSFASVTRNYSAVTGACLLTKKSVFQEVDGFDEHNFGVAYGDVDYCYKLRDLGYRIVFSASSLLYHHEGFTRGFIDNPKELANFRRKYVDFEDIYYNGNLSLENERFEIASKSFSAGRIQSIKTLICTFTLDWTGAALHQLEICIDLKIKKVLEPIVYCHIDGPLREEYEKNGIPVYVFDHPLSGVYKIDDYNSAIEKYSLFFQKHNFELIYANTYQTFYAVETAKMLDIPSIWNIHESEPWQSYFNFLGPEIACAALKCFPYPYKVVYVSDATRKNCEQLNSHHNFATVHNGLDFDKFEKKKQLIQRNIVRSRFNLKDDEIMVLSLGTVCERKGQLDLVEAIEHLPNELLQNIRCFIVGNRQSDYSNLIATKVKAMSSDIASIISIIPETSEVEQYYAAADIFICTSRVESYPRIILEAMAFDLPIITTPVFGIVEQVKENINAYFYEPGDISSLSTKIAFLISNHEKRNEMRENSKHVLRSLNNFSDMVNAYEEFFKEAWISGYSR